jgi:hypothetical protein
MDQVQAAQRCVQRLENRKYFRQISLFQQALLSQDLPYPFPLFYSIFFCQDLLVINLIDILLYSRRLCKGYGIGFFRLLGLGHSQARNAQQNSAKTTETMF